MNFRFGSSYIKYLPSVALRKFICTAETCSLAAYKSARILRRSTITRLGRQSLARSSPAMSPPKTIEGASLLRADGHVPGQRNSKLTRLPELCGRDVESVQSRSDGRGRGSLFRGCTSFLDPRGRIRLCATADARRIADFTPKTNGRGHRVSVLFGRSLKRGCHGTYSQ